jgi:DNA-binding transcriptional regulator YdaS (Cro superfamily)
MFFSDNSVRIAVSKIGGVTKTSNLLGVSNGAVHKWLSAQRVPNIDKAKQLAQLSGIALEKVRPV